MKIERQYSLADKICLGFDQFLRALADTPKTTGRAYPADKKEDSVLTPKEAQEASALMRINHAGEICAQALYHGQAIAAQGGKTADKLRLAAIEEGDHLAWCSQRLAELGGHTSYLTPFWYLGSFCIGLTAGLAGDRWSLGFLAETEKQVVQHLQGHLQRLPEKDEKSRKVLQQMQRDEEKHRQEAEQLGAATLPHFLQKAMRWVSKIMVKLTYWV